jgi:hypothetical protein
MSFRVKGKVIKILAEQKGTSARGEWKKQDFIIETSEDQYPKKICFSIFNDKAASLSGVNIGSDVEVFFNIESREYNDKWFHNVTAFRIEKAEENIPSQTPPPYSAADIPPIESADSDDLPF